MDEEVYGAIISEWSGGGLARCLAGEVPPIYPQPHPSRVVEWHMSEVRIPWTEAEDAIVRERYLVQGVSGILDLLPGRSKDAIRSRARKFGVQASIYGCRQRGQP